MLTKDSLSSFDISVTEEKKQFKEQILTPFIKALVTHIKEHLPDTGIFAAFSLFDPSKLPVSSEATVLEKYMYGEAQFDVLMKQYGGDSNTALIDSSVLQMEWHSLRSYISLNCQTLSMGDVVNFLPQKQLCGVLSQTSPF